MKTYKQKTVKVLDHIVCDICGKICTDDYYNNHENATLEAMWGYNSGRDGDRFEIHLCENCFGDTLGFLSDKRKEYGFIPPDNLDALHGSKYDII